MKNVAVANSNSSATVVHNANRTAGGARSWFSVNLALTAFVIGVCTLELTNPPGPIKPWNLVMVIGAGLAIVLVVVSLKVCPALPQPRIFAIDVVFISYLVYCALTGFWSVSPVDTLVQVAYLFIAWLATLFLRICPPAQVVRVLVGTGLTLVLLSFGMVVVAPGQAFQPSYDIFPELRGVFQHQQRLGLFSGALLGILAVSWVNRRRDVAILASALHRHAVGLMFLVCFIASFARLNMLYCLVSVVFTFGLMLNRATRLLALLAAIAIGIWIWIDQASLLMLIGGEGGSTLTGRTTVWERTQLMIDDGGLLGYGFATFYTREFDSYWGGYRAPSAHSSFLQSTFETGYPGLLLVCLMIFVHLVSAYKVGIALGRVPFSLFLVILALLSSLTGVTYAGKPSILLLLVLLVLSSELQQASLLRDDRPKHPKAPSMGMGR